jgi:hypothetical protein
LRHGWHARQTLHPKLGKAGNKTLKAIDLVALSVLGKEFQLETKWKLQGFAIAAASFSK